MLGGRRRGDETGGRTVGLHLVKDNKRNKMCLALGDDFTATVPPKMGRRARYK